MDQVISPSLVELALTRKQELEQERVAEQQRRLAAQAENKKLQLQNFETLRVLLSPLTGQQLADGNRLYLVIHNKEYFWGIKNTFALKASVNDTLTIECEGRFVYLSGSTTCIRPFFQRRGFESLTDLLSEITNWLAVRI